MKKIELDNILEQFNIQVDNPVCFLNQETSKHFLNSSDNKAKYRLFMKASQLEAMRAVHQAIANEREAANNLIKEKSAYLPELERELCEWEEKFKKCLSAEKLKQKLAVLYQEAAWAITISNEKTVEESERELKVHERSREKVEKKIDELKMNERGFSETNKSDKMTIIKLTQEAKSLKTHEAEILARFNEANLAHRKILVEIKKLKVFLEFFETFYSYFGFIKS